MARRSATNERYQKYTSPSGRTRKSAAAAKPKRAAGATPTPTKGKSSGSSAKSGPLTPPTEEYRRWRRIWWILLGAALVLTAGSWALRTYTELVMISSIMLGAGYASIFTALYIDWTKLRRMRTEWIKAGRPTGDKATVKAKKADTTSDAPADDDSAGGTGTTS